MLAERIELLADYCDEGHGISSLELRAIAAEVRELENDWANSFVLMQEEYERYRELEALEQRWLRWRGLQEPIDAG